MNIFKTLITLAILAGVAGVGLVIAAPKYPQAQAVVDKLHLAALQPVADETLATTAQIQTQLPQLGSVLGVKTEAINKDTPTASLPQKTLEYARYAYCQQVVVDYESRYGITRPATPSAKPRASEPPRPSGTPRVETHAAETPRPTNTPKTAGEPPKASSDLKLRK